MQDNNYISPGPRFPSQNATDPNAQSGQGVQPKPDIAAPVTKSKKPLIIGIIAAVVVVAVAAIVAVVVINNQQSDNPSSPDTPPSPASSYLYEGKQIFQAPDSDEMDSVPDAFIVRSWEEMNQYIGADEALITEFANHTDEFDFNNYAYAVVRIMDVCEVNVVGVGITEINGDHAKALVEVNHHCGLCAPSYYFYIVPFKGNSVTHIETETVVLQTEECDPDVVYKPVIYLYPAKTTDISVKLGAPQKLTVSYPTYMTGWRVKAQPNGNLTDLSTGRNLYALYYEAGDMDYGGIRDEGFVVKGSDAAAFLEQKLAKLGLTEREAEEFIIYWLPQLQNNPYNYIYFALTEETAQNMPLDVSPRPDTVIRFTMAYYPLQKPLKIKEQKLPETPDRKGFTLVEWGGTLLHPNSN